ncbi:hypothetical protein D3C76_745810 [compost metagenome]
MFEVHWAAFGVVGQALDAHDRRAGLDVQRLGQVAVGQHRVDGEVGVTQGQAAVVFQDQEDVAGDQVSLLQAFAKGFGQVGDFQRNRLAVDQPYPLDLRHGLAFGNLQAFGDQLVGGDEFEAAQAVDHLITATGHGLGEALQGADVLEGFRLGDEGALAVDLEDQPFLLQIAEGLAHRDAADLEQRAELAFGRHLAVLRVFTVEDARTEDVAQLGVQRDTAV